MKRVIFDIIMLLCALLLPWWTSAILAMMGMFLFFQFYEFLGVGVLIYSLYVVPLHSIITKPIGFACIVLFMYIAIQTLRQYLIVYQS